MILMRYIKELPPTLKWISTNLLHWYCCELDWIDLKIQQKQTSTDFLGQFRTKPAIDFIRVDNNLITVNLAANHRVRAKVTVQWPSIIPTYIIINSKPQSTENQKQDFLTNNYMQHNQKINFLPSAYVNTRSFCPYDSLN